MKALITGASGFVGKHLGSHLLSCGDDVSAPDLETLDIRNFNQTKTVIASHCPEVIYHLAGLAFVPECENNFSAALEINVAGTENILKAVRELNRECAVVLVSSGEVYGKVGASKLPSREEDELNPVNNYSYSKVFAEKLGMRAISQFKQRVVIMRPFNHIGPGQNTLFVVASFAEQLAEMKKGRREPILRVGNLSAKRDLTDVRDIVRGYRLAATKGEGIYNLCTSKPVTIQSVLDQLIEISGLNVKIEIDQERLRASDNPESTGSHEKAKRELGWEPQISLTQSLRDSFDYFMSK